MSLKINIKHKTYEVICPVSGKHVFVRGLSIAEQNVLSSPVTSYTEGLKILLNVFYDAIQNKEVFKMTDDPNEDLFESFLKQVYWDDLTAIAIGILNRMNPDKNATLDLKVICTNENAPEVNEQGICGKQYTARFPYSNLISSINVNEDQEPIYNVKIEDEFPDYGVKVIVEAPNLFKELILLSIVDKLNRSDKVFKKHGISEYHKDALIATIFSMSSILEVQELENPENKIGLDFDKEIKIDDVIEFGKVLIQFESLNELTRKINPKKYGLESIGVSKCPKCGYEQEIDLKEWIIDTFFPPINKWWRFN